MSSPRSVDEFNDEWLSAYVDSELSPDERAAVEERLRTDPAARQLLGELRRASEAVQSLPRQTLPRDLRSSVLAEIAQRRPAIQPASTLAARPVEASQRGPRVRTWAWAAAAVAAALMLMALLPDDAGDDRPLAEAPGEKDAVGGAGVDAAAEARTGEPPHAPTPGAAAPGADRDADQMKSAASGGVPSAVESSAARRDADHGFTPTPAASEGAGDPQVRRIDVTVAAEHGAERFERVLAAQGVALSDEAPPADVAALRVATPDGEAAFVDGVLVEASAERIDALIAALRADGDAFAVVEDEEQDGAEPPAEPAAGGEEGRSDDAASAIAWRLKPGVVEALTADGAAAADAAGPAGDRVRALFVLRGVAGQR